MNAAFDVAVVGAGPAGSSAAYHLAKHGRRVVLLERSVFPRDKACGDGLTRNSLQLLDELGLANQLEAYQRVSGLRLVTESKGHRDFKYSPGRRGLPDYGAVVRRWDLDHLLVQKAVEAGAVLWQTAIVTDPVMKGDRVCGLRVRRQNDHQEVSATFVVAADGAHSALARKVGLVNPDRWSIGYALRGYFTSISDAASLFSFYVPLLDPVSDRMLTGYGWVFPMSGGAANIGAGFLPCQLEDGDLNLRVIFDSFIQRLRGTDDRFRHMQLAGALRGAPVYVGFKPSHCAGRGMLVAGDAAGLVDPSTGEGIGTALESGQLVAQILNEALSARDPMRADLRAYCDTLETRFRDRFAIRRNQVKKFAFVWKLLENTFDVERPVFESVRHALVDNNAPGDALDTLPSDLRWLQTTATADDVQGVRRQLGTIIESELPFLAEVCSDLAQSTGSFVRSALVFLAARCGSVHRPDAAALATSIELAHLALTLHDDVLDTAGSRRDVRWPNQFTVMAGDYLLAKAYGLAARLGAGIAQSLSRGSADVYMAKMWEAGTWDARRLEQEYLLFIEKKVATFYELACRLGGQLGNVRNDAAQQLAEYGRHLGTAFALTDEILDLLTNIDEPLKHPIARLLEKGACSWPMIVVLRKPDGDAFRALLSHHPVTEHQIRQTLAILRDRQVLGETLGLAQQFATRARRASDALFHSEARRSFGTLATFVVDRIPDVIGDFDPRRHDRALSRS